MPRERVQHGKMWTRSDTSKTKDSPGLVESRQWHPGMDVPPGHTVREDPSMDVSWNRDGGWVQIHYIATLDWWEQFKNDSQPGVYGDGYRSVVTDVLSRQEINHMIRTLRRARDAAYGSDE